MADRRNPVAELDKPLFQNSRGGTLEGELVEISWSLGRAAKQLPAIRKWLNRLAIRRGRHRIFSGTARGRGPVLPYGPVMIVYADDEHGRTHCYLTAIDVDFDRALLSEAILGELTGGPDHLDPDHFVPNPKFLHFLHWVLARHGASAPGFLAEAARQKHGYVYIVDKRTPTPSDHVPPEDIIGAIEIADEKPLRYLGSPNYAALTARGPTQLDPWLLARLVDELRALGLPHREGR